MTALADQQKIWRNKVGSFSPFFQQPLARRCPRISTAHACPARRLNRRSAMFKGRRLACILAWRPAYIADRHLVRSAGQGAGKGGIQLCIEFAGRRCFSVRFLISVHPLDNRPRIHHTAFAEFHSRFEITPPDGAARICAEVVPAALFAAA